MDHQLALQVGCLVVVDHVALSQLIDHRQNARKHFFSRFLVFLCAQFLDCITSSFVLITVTQTYAFVSSDSL